MSIKKIFTGLWRGYKKFAKVLGRFNTLLILTLVFFVLFPLFKLLFVFKRERLSLKTSWQNKEKEEEKSYEQQF